MQLDARDSKLYLGALTVGMLVVLSAAVTKRGNYLLPLLPPLFLLLAVVTIDWWKSCARPSRRHWWTQVTCVALFAVLPVSGVLAYLKHAEPIGVGFLALVVALTALGSIAAARGLRDLAASTLAACALAAVIGLFGVCARLLAPFKDMTPFIASVGELIPHDQPIYVWGNVDETLRGIVPFVTSRDAVPLDAASIQVVRPRYVLMQRKEGYADVPAIQQAYESVESRMFGEGREMILWRALPYAHPIHERSSAVPQERSEEPSP